MSMCKFISCVIGRGGLLWWLCYFGRILLAFPLLHFVLWGQMCLLLQVPLDFLLLYSNLLWWMEHLFLMLVLEGLVGLHRTGQFQLLWHQGLGHRLGLLWCWMVHLRMKPKSFCHFEVASKYCISDTFVDYEGHSIYSKGFSPKVVEIMVIWIKSTRSGPF